MIQGEQQPGKHEWLSLSASELWLVKRSKLFRSMNQICGSKHSSMGINYEKKHKYR